MARLYSTAFILLSGSLLFGVSTAAKAQSSSLCPPQELTFTGWENWQQVTHKPVRSVGHSNNWVGIFVNTGASKVYLSAGSLYPECAAIIKPVYAGPEGLTVEKLTIMVKMADGYDPENGNWWYASADPTGTKIVPKLSRTACIACHEQARDTDYLFSNEVLEAASEQAPD